MYSEEYKCACERLLLSMCKKNILQLAYMPALHTMVEGDEGEKKCVPHAIGMILSFICFKILGRVSNITSQLSNFGEVLCSLSSETSQLLDGVDICYSICYRVLTKVTVKKIVRMVS